MHPKIESFYRSILKLAGLYVGDDDTIKPLNEKTGEFQIMNKPVALPTPEALRNPGDRMIFHPLNEDYIAPEKSAALASYRSRLVKQINLTYLQIVTWAIQIATSIDLQKRVRDEDLINMLGSLKDPDEKLLDVFRQLTKKAVEKHGESCYVGLFVKKNGQIDDEDLEAMGKVNHHFIKALEEVMELPSNEMRVYDVKLRKRDVHNLYTIFTWLSPEHTDENRYRDGSHSVVFRFLDVILRASCTVTGNLNKCLDAIAEVMDDKDKVKSYLFDVMWITDILDLYSMKKEIRSIPNQDPANSTATKIPMVKARDEDVEEDLMSVQRTSASPLEPEPRPTIPSYDPGHERQSHIRREEREVPNPLDIIRQRAAQGRMGQVPSSRTYPAEPAYGDPYGDPYGRQSNLQSAIPSYSGYGESYSGQPYGRPYAEDPYRRGSSLQGNGKPLPSWVESRNR